MKSFEEEIMGSPSLTMDVVDLKLASEESQPDLGHLLEASDDELGFPPSSSPVGALSEGKAKLGRLDSDSSEHGGELSGFSNYDSFEFGMVRTDNNSNDEYLALQF
ncbi:uncharacterized protein Fot_32043 [Forsythia ovata]|uniref:Uncharacterized protein n=1 Tax=Forsythia ovata TaxID=205694 RepID=A0ABD1T6M9_9LAMI